jgi:hypothetical protein
VRSDRELGAGAADVLVGGVLVSSEWDLSQVVGLVDVLVVELS